MTFLFCTQASQDVSAKFQFDSFKLQYIFVHIINLLVVDRILNDFLLM